jgi:hypothetical protein
MPWSIAHTPASPNDAVPVIATVVFPDAPFTWPMARHLGISRDFLDRAVRNREVIRLFRGAYLRADIEVTPLVRAQTLALVVGPNCVMCDRTAAWILGVECYEYRQLDGPLPIESYVLRGNDPTDRLECSGGTRDLQPCDWIEIAGVPVTTPIRTALDLGCKLRRRQALAAMDALMRAHGFTRDDMRRLLPRYFRRRGVIQLRELVPLVDGRAESTGESWSRLEIRDRGLPAPEPQYWVHVAGVPTYRLDLAYPHARVVVEYDGEEFHSSEEDRARDEARRGWLREHGWTVIVLDKDSFTEEAILVWIRELREALGLA